MDEIYENQYDAIEEMTTKRQYVSTKSKVGYKKDYEGDDCLYPSFNAKVNFPLIWPLLTISRDRIMNVSMTNREDMYKFKEAINELSNELNNALEFFERKSRELNQKSKEPLSDLQKAIIEDEEDVI